MAILPFLLLIIIKQLTIFSYQFSSATDIITPSQPLADGSTLVSKDGSFELGFFNPGTSTNRYVGIWYNNIPDKTVVWVANRDNPIKDNSSVLTINTQGNLVLVSHNNSVLWSTTNKASSPNPIVQLLDSGNLVLRDEKDSDPESFLWKSFDYPSDTLLPGMKVGWDLKKGINRRLTAWRNWDDPSPGDFTCGISFGSIPELIMWKGSSVYHRSGPWNGVRFSSSPLLKQNQSFDIQFVNNQNEAYFTFNLKNKSSISRVVLNQTALSRQRFIWFPENQAWSLYLSVPVDDCDDYNRCGPYGNCMVGELPICQCLNGFKPKSRQNWDAMNWTQGCVRSEPWQCGVKGRDGFQRFSGLKLPDATNSWANRSMTLEDCKAECLNNCSCIAYANLDVRGKGSGCAIWFGDLTDIRVVSTAGQDLYIRMAVSDTVQGDANAVGNKKKMALIISFTVLFLLVLIFTFSYFRWRKRKSREKTMSTEMRDECEQEDMELPFFDLGKIVKATNAFSTDNKLGEGGFGPVYWGKLEDGQEIAVKRLSKSSGQGLKEFRNEVILCSKLQHRNLVKVLGCCIQGEEKMLIYEYMPNKSLDSFLFDFAGSKLLDWPKRFHILYGIARGLLYLHQDSRLRIIHRDLKASNVLLDNELNPKISDFGMARMFGGDQIEGKTNKVAGTFGYMAPEYAIDGLFSIKSDVFSFGIILLEIISGKKNKGVYFPDQSQNLISHAWRLWKQGKPMELIDAGLRDSCIMSEVLRCIQIGLLCVQQHPNDRPNMAAVVVMLSGENALPKPKEPGLLLENSLMQGQFCGNEILSSSTNEITMTLLEAR